MTEPEDPALELALAAREHEAARLRPAVEGLPVEASGIQAPVTVLLAIASAARSSKPRRAQAGAGHRLGGGVAREDAVTLRLHQPEALVDLVHHRDGGRPGVSPLTAVSRWRLRSR